MDIDYRTMCVVRSRRRALWAGFRCVRRTLALRWLLWRRFSPVLSGAVSAGVLFAVGFAVSFALCQLALA